MSAGLAAALTPLRRKGMPMAGPMPGPKKKLKAQPLYLLPEEWTEFDEITEFHGEALTSLGFDAVSRNDMLRSFLEWARRGYWDQVGGPPASKDDRTKKIAKLAELLRKQFGDQAR